MINQFYSLFLQIFNGIYAHCNLDTYGQTVPATQVVGSATLFFCNIGIQDQRSDPYLHNKCL